MTDVHTDINGAVQISGYGNAAAKCIVLVMTVMIATILVMATTATQGPKES